MPRSTQHGRHFRKVKIGEAFQTSRLSRGKHTVLCSHCPKWKNRHCAIQCKDMTERHPACKYGKLLIAAQKQAAKWRKK